MLSQIRESFADYLREKNYFSQTPAIPVYTEKLKTLENDLQKGLQEFGLSVLITTAVARNGLNQVPRKLVFDDVAVIVHVLEQPRVNIKLGIGASDVAEAVAWYGKQFAPLDDAHLVLKDIVLGEHPTCLAYHVVFTMRAAIDSEPQRPALPHQPNLNQQPIQ